MDIVYEATTLEDIIEDINAAVRQVTNYGGDTVDLHIYRSTRLPNEYLIRVMTPLGENLLFEVSKVGERFVLRFLCSNWR